MITSREEYAKRLEICGECPRKMGPLCGVCNCVIRIKAGIRRMKCPIGKWEAERRNNGKQ